MSVFINLSKTVQTVDHDILICKLRNYGVTRNHLKLFESYLNNRKQFIIFNDRNTSFADIKCGVPQGSILGPLLLLIYANDLSRASDILHPIMFADDINLFYSHKDIKKLFHTVNTKLVKAKKLSKLIISLKLINDHLMQKKTSYTLFHKPSTKDD